MFDPVRERGKSGGGGARRRLVDRERLLGELFPLLACIEWSVGVARGGAGGGAGKSVERTTSKKEDVRGEPWRAFGFVVCEWGRWCVGAVTDDGTCPRLGTPNSSTSMGLFRPLSAGLEVTE